MAKMKTINVMLDEGAFMPERAHEDDAGMDLRCLVGGTVIAHGTHLYETGVHVEIPKGYVGLLLSKSGLNAKEGITTVGVIDCGYSGSIKVCVHNDSDHAKTFYKGDKLTQLVIMPIATPTPVLVDHFADSERGDNGFGSTGK